MKKKTIGIIGGMGPLATVDLFNKIVLNTKAQKDQEHIRVVVDNNTNIPDRTKAILQNGADPVKELVKSAKRLSKMGADFLIMPCNTAHYFHSKVQKKINIPLLNMLKITLNALKEQGITKAGLLATDGTIQSGIYKTVFEGSGIELIYPEKEGQNAVMSMIYDGVKAGVKDFDTSGVKKAIKDLEDKGAKVMILGCTELPLAVKMYNLDCISIDPTLELAKEAIRKAGGELI